MYSAYISLFTKGKIETTSHFMKQNCFYYTSIMYVGSMPLFSVRVRACARVPVRACLSVRAYVSLRAWLVVRGCACVSVRACPCMCFRACA